MNLIVLIGRLAGDPALRYTEAGDPVGSFVLAVDRSRKNAADSADFIDVIVWRRLAEQIVQSLHKGSLVAVEGRLQMRVFNAQDGHRRKVAEVVATRCVPIEKQA